jgi:spore maturation protein CgeB
MRITFLGNWSVSYSTETHHGKSLESLGHEVIRLQEPKAPAAQIQAEAEKSDLFVWTHTHGWVTPGIEGVLHRLKKAGVPVVAYHLDLYMGIQRWTQYEEDPYMRMIDHFFTVDKLMAAWLNNNTEVRGHFLPAGVFDQECYLAEPTSPHGNDVVFVGSRGYHREWAYRPQLIDWLKATYGPRFTHVGGDGQTGTVRGDDLNQLYASSKVAIGDSLCLNFNYPYYASDRVFETLGRGCAIIHPRIQGMEEWFEDRKHLAFYEFGDFDGLRKLIDYYLEHDEEREAMRRAGHEHVKANHTYVHRWQEILETVFA